MEVTDGNIVQYTAAEKTLKKYKSQFFTGHTLLQTKNIVVMANWQ